MSFWEHLTNAVRSIKANKLRTALSSLGIIIGVSSVIILLAFGEGTQRSITSSIQSLGTNLLTLVPGGTRQTDARNTTNLRSQTDVFTLQDTLGLTGLANIAAVAPQINGRKQVIYDTKNTSTTIYGVTPAYLSVRSSNVQYGEFISDENVINGDKVAILGVTTLSNLFNNENPLGKQIRIGTTFFTVVGVMEEKGGSAFNNADDAIFIPLTTAQNRIFGTKYLTQIGVTVSNADAINEAKQSLSEYFYQRFGIIDPATANFSIISSADTLSTISTVTGALKAFLGGIAAISLIVGGIGVMNIMLVSVSERTREIGIRRSIGALNRDIIFQFLTESVMLTLIGGLIGIGLSVMVVLLMKKANIEAYITTYVVVLSFSCAVSIGIIFGLLPAYKAAKLKPIDALRSE